MTKLTVSSGIYAPMWSSQMAAHTGLFVVATPIGHIEDISLRAVQTLAQVQGILCEDTRMTRTLLGHYGLKTPCYSFHAHNEHTKQAGVLHLLREGASLALVSDRGTPLISDPGFSLVRACFHEGIEVHALPGPSAVMVAAVLSGFACARFAFEGFVPTKLKDRAACLTRLAAQDVSVILFESPHRLAVLLEDLKAVCGSDRQACVLRELTKKFQQRQAGTLEVLLVWSQQQTHLGECVIVLAPAVRDLEKHHKNKYADHVPD